MVELQIVIPALRVRVRVTRFPFRFKRVQRRELIKSRRKMLSALVLLLPTS